MVFVVDAGDNAFYY